MIDTTETKFTPGPWSVDRNVIRGDADQFGRTVAIASTLNVAWPYGRRATKEEPYNAHLIAAAPELYEALIVARDYVQAELEMRKRSLAGHPQKWEMEERDLALINAALTKVRGES